MNPLEDNGDALVKFIESAQPAELDALLKKSGFFELLAVAPTDPRPPMLTVEIRSTDWIPTSLDGQPLTRKIRLNDSIGQMQAGTFEDMPMAA